MADLPLRTLIIIPAYNESKSIVSVVEGVIAAGYDYVVVNDGSTDNTLDICRQHDFNVLNLEQNLGIGGAVQAGHKYAKQYDYNVDIQYDGDGQHEISCVPALLEGIRAGNDLVIGSRFIGGDNEFKSTFMRRVGIKWLKFWIRLFTGKNVSDATSGFRASNHNAIALFCETYPADYPEPESIAYAARRGLHVSEVPVVMHERAEGQSSIGGFSSVYYMIKVSLAIVIARTAQNK